MQHECAFILKGIFLIIFFYGNVCIILWKPEAENKHLASWLKKMQIMDLQLYCTPSDFMH